MPALFLWKKCLKFSCGKSALSGALSEDLLRRSILWLFWDIFAYFSIYGELEKIIPELSSNTFL